MKRLIQYVYWSVILLVNPISIISRMCQGRNGLLHGIYKALWLLKTLQKVNWASSVVRETDPNHNTSTSILTCIKNSLVCSYVMPVECISIRSVHIKFFLIAEHNGAPLNWCEHQLFEIPIHSLLFMKLSHHWSCPHLPPGHFGRSCFFSPNGRSWKCQLQIISDFLYRVQACQKLSLNFSAHFICEQWVPSIWRSVLFRNWTVYQVDYWCFLFPDSISNQSNGAVFQT